MPSKAKVGPDRCWLSDNLGIQEIPPSISEGSTVSTRVSGTDGLELAICLQGSGPHFCPGGNPNARRRVGESPFQVEPFSMFLAILRLKEFGGPISVALQGLVLGGGLAMALLADLRVLDGNASMCFGNLSRGMVPCMLLSLHFALSLADAMDLYLTDDILPAAMWHQLTGDSLVDGVTETKTEAFQQLQRLRLSYVATQLTDNFQLRFAREAQALQLSLRCESSPLVMKASFEADVKLEESVDTSHLHQVQEVSQVIIPVPSQKLDASIQPNLTSVTQLLLTSAWKIPSTCLKASKSVGKHWEWHPTERLLPTLQLC